MHKSLEERVADLERQVGRWRWMSAGLLILAVGVIVLGAGPPIDWTRHIAPGNHGEFDVVTARGLRIMSQYGTSVLHLGSDARGNAFLTMNTAWEKPTAALTVDGSGHGQLELMGPGPRGPVVALRADGVGNGTVVVQSADRGTAAVLQAVPGAAGVRLHEDGTP